MSKKLAWIFVLLACLPYLEGGSGRGTENLARIAWSALKAVISPQSPPKLDQSKSEDTPKKTGRTTGQKSHTPIKLHMPKSPTHPSSPPNRSSPPSVKSLERGRQEKTEIPHSTGTSSSEAPKFTSSIILAQFMQLMNISPHDTNADYSSRTNTNQESTSSSTSTDAPTTNQTPTPGSNRREHLSLFNGAGGRTLMLGGTGSPMPSLNYHQPRHTDTIFSSPSTFQAFGMDASRQLSPRSNHPAPEHANVLVQSTSQTVDMESSHQLLPSNDHPALEQPADILVSSTSQNVVDVGAPQHLLGLNVNFSHGAAPVQIVRLLTPEELVRLPTEGLDIDFEGSVLHLPPMPSRSSTMSLKLPPGVSSALGVGNEVTMQVTVSSANNRQARALKGQTSNHAMLVGNDGLITLPAITGEPISSSILRRELPEQDQEIVGASTSTSLNSSQPYAPISGREEVYPELPVPLNVEFGQQTSTHLPQPQGVLRRIEAPLPTTNSLSISTNSSEISVQFGELEGIEQSGVVVPNMSIPREPLARITFPTEIAVLVRPNNPNVSIFTLNNPENEPQIAAVMPASEIDANFDFTCHLPTLPLVGRSTVPLQDQQEDNFEFTQGLDASMASSGSENFDFTMNISSLPKPTGAFQDVDVGKLINFYENLGKYQSSVQQIPQNGQRSIPNLGLVFGQGSPSTVPNQVSVPLSINSNQEQPDPQVQDIVILGVGDEEHAAIQNDQSTTSSNGQNSQPPSNQGQQAQFTVLRMPDARNEGQVTEEHSETGESRNLALGRQDPQTSDYPTNSSLPPISTGASQSVPKLVAGFEAHNNQSSGQQIPRRGLGRGLNWEQHSQPLVSNQTQNTSPNEQSPLPLGLETDSEPSLQTETHVPLHQPGNQELEPTMEIGKRHRIIPQVLNFPTNSPPLPRSTSASQSVPELVTLFKRFEDQSLGPILRQQHPQSSTRLNQSQQPIQHVQDTMIFGVGGEDHATIQNNGSASFSNGQSLQPSSNQGQQSVQQTQLQSVLQMTDVPSSTTDSPRTRLLTLHLQLPNGRSSIVGMQVYESVFEDAEQMRGLIQWLLSQVTGEHSEGRESTALISQEQTLQVLSSSMSSSPRSTGASQSVPELAALFGNLKNQSLRQQHPQLLNESVQGQQPVQVVRNPESINMGDAERLLTNVTPIVFNLSTSSILSGEDVLRGAQALQQVIKENSHGNITIKVTLPEGSISNLNVEQSNSAIPLSNNGTSSMAIQSNLFTMDPPQALSRMNTHEQSSDLSGSEATNRVENSESNPSTQSPKGVSDVHHSENVNGQVPKGLVQNQENSTPSSTSASHHGQPSQQRFTVPSNQEDGLHEEGSTTIPITMPPKDASAPSPNGHVKEGNEGQDSEGIDVSKDVEKSLPLPPLQQPTETSSVSLTGSLPSTSSEVVEIGRFEVMIPPISKRRTVPFTAKDMNGEGNVHSSNMHMYVAPKKIENANHSKDNESSGDKSTQKDESSTVPSKLNDQKPEVKIRAGVENVVESLASSSSSTSSSSTDENGSRNVNSSKNEESNINPSQSPLSQSSFSSTEVVNNVLDTNKQGDEPVTHASDVSFSSGIVSTGVSSLPDHVSSIGSLASLTNVNSPVTPIVGRATAQPIPSTTLSIPQKISSPEKILPLPSSLQQTTETSTSSTGSLSNTASKVVNVGEFEIVVPPINKRKAVPSSSVASKDMNGERVESAYRDNVYVAPKKIEDTSHPRNDKSNEHESTEREESSTDPSQSNDQGQERLKQGPQGKPKWQPQRRVQWQPKKQPEGQSKEQPKKQPKRRLLDWQPKVQPKVQPKGHALKWQPKDQSQGQHQGNNQTQPIVPKIQKVPKDNDPSPPPQPTNNASSSSSPISSGKDRDVNDPKNEESRGDESAEKEESNTDHSQSNDQEADMRVESGEGPSFKIAGALKKAERSSSKNAIASLDSGTFSMTNQPKLPQNEGFMGFLSKENVTAQPTVSVIQPAPQAIPRVKKMPPSRPPPPRPTNVSLPKGNENNSEEESGTNPPQPLLPPTNAENKILATEEQVGDALNIQIQDKFVLVKGLQGLVNVLEAQRETFRVANIGIPLSNVALIQFPQGRIKQAIATFGQLQKPDALLTVAISTVFQTFEMGTWTISDIEKIEVNADESAKNPGTVHVTIATALTPDAAHKLKTQKVETSMIVRFLNQADAQVAQIQKIESLEQVLQGSFETTVPGKRQRSSFPRSSSTSPEDLSMHHGETFRLKSDSNSGDGITTDPLPDTKIDIPGSRIHADDEDEATIVDPRSSYEMGGRAPHVSSYTGSHSNFSSLNTVDDDLDPAFTSCSRYVFALRGGTPTDRDNALLSLPSHCMADTQLLGVLEERDMPMIRPEAFEGVTPLAFADLKHRHLLLPEQFAHLPDSTIGIITPEDMSKMRDDILSKCTAQKLRMLSKETWASLRLSQQLAIPLSVLKDLPTDRLNALHADVLSRLAHEKSGSNHVIPSLTGILLALLVILVF